MGAFGEYADDFLAHGIPVVPTRGDDGKTPCVRSWQKIGSVLSKSKALADSGKFDDANLAFITGQKSKITVLDIDNPDPKALNTALARFGESPIVIKTGSGKYHAYYKHNGESRMTRPLKHDPLYKDIDILGEGICLAPPSQRPDKGGALYEWIAGDLDDIDRLPILENVPEHCLKSVGVKLNSRTGIAIGERNKALFRSTLRDLANGVKDDDLMANAIAFCTVSLEENLPFPEILKTVNSAQAIHDRGDNWIGQDARAVITISELDAMEGNADAAFLLMKLRASHGWREGQPFALAKAYATALGWTLPRFTNARKFLAEKSLVKCIHRGGRGPNDPPLYTLL